MSTKSKSTRGKAAKVRPVPPGMHTVTPHLICDEAAKAIAFYKKAFGAVEMLRIPGANGKLMHASVRIGDSAVMLVDESPEWGSLGPKALKGSTVVIHLYVEDADAVVKRAVKAGATVKLPVQEMFWGARYGQIEDPFGHLWSVATQVRNLTPKELQKAAKAFCA